MDIVWFAEIKWDYLKTRKQQIIRRKPDDVRLLYLEPYVKGRVNRYQLRAEGDILCATVPFIKAVPYPPVKWFLDQRWGRSLVDRYARFRVSRLIRRAGFVPAAAGLILSNVYAIRIAARFPGRFLVYDCNDAHSAFPGMPPWTRDYFEESFRKADSVFASSQALFDEASAVRGGDAGCELLGNGVEYEHFAAVRDESGWPDPPDPPRIGYLGAIAPWFNFEFMEQLALARPDWEVVMVGPVMLGVEAQAERLARLPNVTVREPVSYEDVPRVLRTFTVGVIPFCYDELTRGVNPNKMYEYLAMGLPVAATAFSGEVKRYPEVVTAADTADEFLRACEAFVTLSSGRDRLAAHREKAIATAEKHDWAAIARTFWERVMSMAAA
jgi:glycosyltransferase involved in cell wall biosynthesis